VTGIPPSTSDISMFDFDNFLAPVIARMYITTTGPERGVSTWYPSCLAIYPKHIVELGGYCGFPASLPRHRH